ALHPGVEILIGILVAQEILDFLSIVDLFLLIGDFLLRDVDPNLLRKNLFVDVLDLVAGNVGLLDAVLQLAQKSGLAASIGRGECAIAYNHLVGPGYCLGATPKVEPAETYASTYPKG